MNVQPGIPSKYGPPLRLLRQLSDEQIEKVCERLEQKRAKHGKNRKVFLCRACGAPITTAEREVHIMGRSIHTFRNPAGVYYTIACFSSAPGCMVHGEPTAEFTWFPGYAWSYAHCGKCLIHLGWKYESGEAVFFGLILAHLLEADASSGEGHEEGAPGG